MAGARTRARTDSAVPNTAGDGGTASTAHGETRERTGETGEGRGAKREGRGATREGRGATGCR